MSFLVLDGLTKRYGDQIAVDGLSLSVEQGEFVSLLGPSGCGKTTTLQMIAGFIDATSGSVMLDGRDLLATPPSRRGLGVVFQSYALFPHMTAAQNVSFGLEMQGIPTAQRQRRVGEALNLVGLLALAERHPRHMSGGQQQRVALARALAIRPRVLLLDEPLSNLDAKLREEMQIELRQIQRTVGTTTILVTHDQCEAMALSDRIVVMNSGRVEQVARPNDAYASPASAFVANFLGKINMFTGCFDADADGGLGIAHIGDGRWSMAGPQGGTLSASVRPERIQFAESGVEAPVCSISGRVVARIFQGSHWLYQVETACGIVTVIQQNSGADGPGESSSVRLTWAASDMAVQPGQAGAVA